MDVEAAQSFNKRDVGNAMFELHRAAKADYKATTKRIAEMNRIYQTEEDSMSGVVMVEKEDIAEWSESWAATICSDPVIQKSIVTAFAAVIENELSRRPTSMVAGSRELDHERNGCAVVGFVTFLVKEREVDGTPHFAICWGSHTYSWSGKPKAKKSLWDKLWTAPKDNIAALVNRSKYVASEKVLSEMDQFSGADDEKSAENPKDSVKDDILDDGHMSEDSNGGDDGEANDDENGPLTADQVAKWSKDDVGVWMLTLFQEGSELQTQFYNRNIDGAKLLRLRARHLNKMSGKKEDKMTILRCINEFNESLID